MNDVITKGEQTREQIVTAAYELFTEQGYHGSSMRQIAERAGIAVGGIYNHFDGKEAIFEAVLLANHPAYVVLPMVEQAEGETVEALIRYAGHTMQETLDNKQDFLDWSWLTSLPVINETAFVAHAKLTKPFVLKVDGRSSRCVMYTAE